MATVKRRPKLTQTPEHYPQQSCILPSTFPAHWSCDHLTVSSYKVTLSIQPNTGAKDLWALSTYVALKTKKQTKNKWRTNQNESSIKKSHLIYYIIYTRTTNSTGFHFSKYTFFWHSIVLKLSFPPWVTMPYFLVKMKAILLKDKFREIQCLSEIQRL